MEALGGRRQAVGGHTAVLFPSAEERPYSMMGGQSSTVWHDRWVGVGTQYFRFKDCISGGN